MAENSIAEMPTFKSAPWCFNGHAHTILCSKLFTNPHLEFERVRIDTPDGDFLDLDISEKKESGNIALLLHGLEGSSNRYYVRRLAKRLYDDGMHIVAMNFRSCSGDMNRKPRYYHSGETKDLSTVLEWVQSRFGEVNIFAAGFSLGASILLNTLRKNGSAVQAFTAISTPFDLHRGSLNLQNGFNRVYNLYFMSSLKNKLELKRREFPELPEFHGNTIFEFDDQITAPIHGFEDAEDYYRRCSSAFFMDEINTPGLIIHSREDPICPFDYVPGKAIQKNSALTTLYTSKGGHVGFWSLPPGWVEDSVSRYFQKFTTV